MPMTLAPDARQDESDQEQDFVDFSVVVPLYKVERYVERCIQGLLAQDYPENRFEILIVDNNSLDFSAQIVRRYPQVTLLHETKQGAYAARNRGLAQAKGEIVAFTDSDCVPEPDWLSCLWAAMRDPKIQIVIGPSHLTSNSTALRLLDKYEHYKADYILSSDDPTVYWGHTNNMAARKKLLDEFGPFVERQRGADVIFVRRVVDAKSCDVVQYEPRARVHHLEIDSLQVYLRKFFLYGRSRQHYSRIIHSRPLTTRERLGVSMRTARSENLSVTQATTLFLLLFAVAGFWYAGALLSYPERREQSLDRTDTVPRHNILSDKNGRVDEGLNVGSATNEKSTPAKGSIRTV